MKTYISRYRSWQRPQKISFWLGCAVLFYTLFGFFIAPPILKAVLEKKLPEALHRPVTIETIRLNPCALSATVEGLNLAKRDGTGAFVAFDRLYVNLESLSLFKKALILQSVTLEKPTLDVSRIDERTFSFSDLLVSPEPVPSQEEPESTHFSINNIQISGGTIRFQDQPTEVNHAITDLQLAIPSISNLPTQVQVTVQPLFSAVVNGTPLSLAGGSKPFAESKATEFDLKMDGIDIPTYLAYIPNPTELILKSALLDLDTRLSYQLLPNQAARLAVTGRVSLRDLEVTDRQGESYLQLPATTLVLAETNLLNKELRLTELNIDAPTVNLTRLADGALLPMALLAQAASEPPSESATAQTPTTEPETPPRLVVDRLRLERGVVTLSDRSLENPANLKLDEISLTADNFSTTPETSSSVALALRVNQSGHVTSQGSFVFEPLALKTAVEVAELQLKDLQPYISEYAKIAVAGGSLAVQGNLEVMPAANDNSWLRFAGKASLAGLAAADTLNGDDLLKWKNLRVDKLEFSSSPFALTIAEILFDDPYVKILINPDGTPNLAALARTSKTDPDAAAAATEATEAATEQQIAIHKVSLNNGRVDFQDRSIKPSYGAKLSQLNGSVTGLSSKPGSLAQVKLEARVDQQAPLAITGTLNPLSAEPQADIQVDFKDFNLTPLSPYTGKYAGYKTAKGKLNLALLYQIKGNLLESSNKVFLDQFTFGEPVNSPDATSLPVTLALALLKDRSGEIYLDIPVAGDLNDPEFSVAGVVIQVVVNLIAKAATSPFALLGALIPEGVDIQHIPFEPGRAELTEASLGKLDVVAKVLHERPGVKMDLAGQVDHQLDSAALARQQLLKLVKLEKLKTSGSKKVAESDAQGIEVSPEEYPVYLPQVYQKALESAPKPAREAAAQAKPANAAEEISRMEQFLLAGIRIEDEELRLLALDRANRVLGQLVDVSKVEPGRLFVVDPQVSQPEEGAEQGSQALVELSIK
jgi:uncharacterized protein involved in outer membrane biogenesis